MASDSKLRLVRDRLYAITPEPASEHSGPGNPTSPKIKKEVIDPAFNRFICAECGDSHISLNYLTAHYNRCHGSNAYVCPIADCGRLFERQAHLTHHLRGKHGDYIPCQHPGCFKKSSPRTLLKHLQTHTTNRARRGYYKCQFDDCKETFADLTRLTQHAYQVHTGIAAASGCPDCQKKFTDDQALYKHYRTEHPFLGPQTLQCPALGCQSTFRDAEDLYRHYRDSNHPPSVRNAASSHLVHRCPFNFCGRAYSSEIALGIHNALAHGSKIGGIRMAVVPPAISVRNASLNVPASSKAVQASSSKTVRTSSSRVVKSSLNTVQSSSSRVVKSLSSKTVQSSSSRAVQPSSSKAVQPSSSKAVQVASGRHLDDSIECTAEFDPVEINDKGEIHLGSGILNCLERNETPDPTSYPQLPAPQSRPIGRVLEMNRSSHDPKEAALDRHERASKSNHVGDEIDFPKKSIGREILQRILFLLQVDEDISIEELYELWIVFLKPGQRQDVVATLSKLNIREAPETIIARLRGSFLAAVISAWIRFKSLLDQTPPQLRDAVGRNPRSSGRDTAWAILMHCMLLEDMRDRAVPEAVSLGFNKIPSRLRYAYQGYKLSADSKFGDIMFALAERAKCRKVHPENYQLTTAMVLEEVRHYRAELIEVVLILYPGSHDSREWLQVFGMP